MTAPLRGLECAQPLRSVLPLYAVTETPGDLPQQRLGGSAGWKDPPPSGLALSPAMDRGRLAPCGRLAPWRADLLGVCWERLLHGLANAAHPRQARSAPC